MFANPAVFGEPLEWLNSPASAETALFDDFMLAGAVMHTKRCKVITYIACALPSPRSYGMSAEQTSIWLLCVPVLVI